MTENSGSAPVAKFGRAQTPPMSPDAFAAYVKAESARYAKLIPELGIKQ